MNGVGCHSRKKPLMWSRLPLAFGEYSLKKQNTHFKLCSGEALERPMPFVLQFNYCRSGLNCLPNKCFNVSF